MKEPAMIITYQDQCRRERDAIAQAIRRAFARPVEKAARKLKTQLKCRDALHQL